MEFKKGVSRVSPALSVHFVGFAVKQNLSKKGDAVKNELLKYLLKRHDDDMVRAIIRIHHSNFFKKPTMWMIRKESI